MTPCLSLRQAVVKREKNGSRFTLRIPALDVWNGELLAVLGPSGCGKSTLLDVLALILRPSRAETFRMFHTNRRRQSSDSTDLLCATQKQLAIIRGRDIGYVLQSGGLLSFLCVRDNILLPGRLSGYSDRTLAPMFDYLVGRLDIAEQLYKKPQHLSGGQRQRVAIARALICRPPLVLADEPTAAVDQETAWDICKIFQSIAREMQTALVVVSHDRALMGQFADRMDTFTISRHSSSDVEAVVFETTRGQTR